MFCERDLQNKKNNICESKKRKKKTFTTYSLEKMSKQN